MGKLGKSMTQEIFCFSIFTFHSDHRVRLVVRNQKWEMEICLVRTLTPSPLPLFSRYPFQSEVIEP